MTIPNEMTTIPSIKHFIDFIHRIPKQNTISFLHTELGKKGVRVVYEKADNYDENKPKYKRIILGTFIRSCSFEFPGVIISPDPDGIFQVIAVPPPPPITRYQTKHMISEVNRCSVMVDGKLVPNIIKANDGTTITLYHFRGEWCISTHRGYNVTNSRATPDKTYKQLLDDVLEEYEEFSYDKLNTDYSYTIGFCHSNFHPFQATIDPTRKPSVKAWFIQSSNLIKFSDARPFVKYDENIGLPLQEKIKTNDINDLFISAKNAYRDFVQTKKVNYGYLLRAGHYQYLIESSLLENIRTLFYSNKFNKLDSIFNKKQYIAVYSFLSADKYETFLNLFPDYTSEFKKLEKVVDDVVNTMVKIASIHNFVPENSRNVVINEFYVKVNETITLSKMKPDDAKGVIYTIIYDAKNTNMIYQLYYGMKD